MKTLTSWIIAASFVLSLASLLAVDASAQEKQEIEIWPDGLPAGAVAIDEAKIKELTAKQEVHEQGHILYVDTPSLTIYPAPADTANGCAVVVCPGGGYNVLAWRHEGLELAEWLNSIGVSAFVLKYRVPRRNPEKIHWEPMQDVQRAIRLVRNNASEYNIDPDRIGVLGFSAGGHLTLMAGIQSDTKSYEAIDDADQVSCKPNFICPIYAAYMADGYKDDVAKLGSLITVDKDSPPTFMAVTGDDKMRGAQAALLFVQLNKAGVNTELHAYAKGGHGYGIRPSEKPVSNWHHQLEGWLKSSGFLSARTDQKVLPEVKQQRK